MLQPTFLSWFGALTSQFDVIRLPVNLSVELATASPALVWRVMMLKSASLTFSRMSISPAFGQDAAVPSIQKAGQRPQVEEGM